MMSPATYSGGRGVSFSQGRACEQLPAGPRGFWWAAEPAPGSGKGLNPAFLTSPSEAGAPGPETPYEQRG